MTRLSNVKVDFVPVAPADAIATTPHDPATCMVGSASLTLIVHAVGSTVDARQTRMRSAVGAVPIASPRIRRAIPGDQVMPGSVTSAPMSGNALSTTLYMPTTREPSGATRTRALYSCKRSTLRKMNNHFGCDAVGALLVNLIASSALVVVSGAMRATRYWPFRPVALPTVPFTDHVPVDGSCTVQEPPTSAEPHPPVTLRVNVSRT